jgi:hypothetical protein
MVIGGYQGYAGWETGRPDFGWHREPEKKAGKSNDRFPPERIGKHPLCKIL